MTSDGEGPINLSGARRLLDLIVSALRPSEIWLFGSRARGNAGPSSDWDLLVVVPDDAPDVDDPLTGWRLTKQSGVPSDVILCRDSEFRDARETPNTLSYEAAHHGVLIYGR